MRTTKLTHFRDNVPALIAIVLVGVLTLFAVLTLISAVYAA